MTKVCLITGSTLGGAEYVAEHLANLLEQQGIETRLEHGPELSDVQDENLWLIVTSTHGAGDVPDNLQPFVNAIKQQQPDLSTIRFAVVGLGNSDYDTFCYAAFEVERCLLAQTAVKICDVFTIDVAQIIDPDQAAEQWLPKFIQSL